MLGELTWEEESDGGLDLAGGESVFLVVSNKSAGLSGDLLEDIVDERVHDGHGSLADAGLWVNLLENSVDVDAEGLGSLSLGGSLSGGFLALGSFSGCSFGHFDGSVSKLKLITKNQTRPRYKAQLNSIRKLRDQS